MPREGLLPCTPAWPGIAELAGAAGRVPLPSHQEGGSEGASKWLLGVKQIEQSVVPAPAVLVYLLG